MPTKADENRTPSLFRDLSNETLAKELGSEIKFCANFNENEAIDDVASEEGEEECKAKMRKGPRLL